MSILVMLIDTLGGLFVMAILLRFLLQLVKADFYNPISQAIVKITSPFLTPLRRIIPGVGGYDIASLVLAFVVQAIFIVLKMKLIGYMVFPPAAILTQSLISVVRVLLDLYTFSLFIIVIASWVAPHSYNPGLMLLRQLTEPLCGAVRRFIPPVGGLDFSVMVILFVIMLLKGSIPSVIFGV